MYIHNVCFMLSYCSLNEVRACNINECGSWTSQFGEPVDGLDVDWWSLVILMLRFDLGIDTT